MLVHCYCFHCKNYRLHTVLAYYGHNIRPVYTNHIKIQSGNAGGPRQMITLMAYSSVNVAKMVYYWVLLQTLQCFHAVIYCSA